MPSSRGFFSLIQFCPDLDRREAVNVGVVLAIPEQTFVGVRMAGDNEGPKQRFGASSFDEARLAASKRAIEARLRQDGPSWTTPDDLARFGAKEGNSLILTSPRTLLAVAPEAELAELFQRLVFVDPRSRRRQAKPDLKTRFEAKLEGVELRRDVRVEVPNFGPMEVPYAFKNGVLNLVQPEGFSVDEGPAMTKAAQLAVRGRLIHRHPEAAGEPSRLIVVGGFDESASEQLKSRIASVLEEHDSRLVREDELDQLVAEVRRDAHA